MMCRWLLVTTRSRCRTSLAAMSSHRLWQRWSSGATGRPVRVLVAASVLAGADGASSSWPADGGSYDERWWRATGCLSTLRQVVGANHRTLATYINTLRC